MHLAVLEMVISVVLVREDKDTQSLIYYVSKVLIDTETKYQPIKVSFSTHNSLPKDKALFLVSPYFCGDHFPTVEYSS